MLWPPLLAPIDWRAQILEGLHALGLTFTADAMAHSEITAVTSSEVTVKLRRVNTN